MKKSFASLCLIFIAIALEASPRERLLMNYDWKFAFGHAADVEKDFNVGTSYFTYLAKAGYGDGAASPDFDDRTWRSLNLPHDWAVEAGFAENASHSHGYKAIGPGFPESSVGWYRKNFHLPVEDDGKRIFIEFDGVYRDARVWVNGFYCGNEPSGYTSFSFDVTEYLNFGGNNVIAIRVDASMEEGWFYEGAGIYRHVWLTKTNPLHVPQYGTFVTTEVSDNAAEVTARVKVLNKALEGKTFDIRNQIVAANGNVVASAVMENISLDAMLSDEFTMKLTVDNPMLWDLDTPNLYELHSHVIQNDAVVDTYRTTFGIRTIEWTPDRGFFLNGRHVKIKGSNNHQNHAGVGTAIPDGLHEWRLMQLKFMGNNAYRTAHYPPSPALLEAADRVGMLILNENRLMGTTDEILDHLRRLMIRDRNHPSVVLWSIGNEEWAIEGNERGARMAEYMQAYAKQFDTTRPINAAVSGAWGNGISSVVEVMGYNYLRHGSTDVHYAKYPWQASLGTEEGSTNTTRGIYFDDYDKQYLAAYDRDTPSGFFSIQHGWKHYADRDYLSGMCLWTGFDYRGEPTPFGFPSVVSYFGMMDLCGLPKDNVYYLKSWWTNDPVLHILPHWNWKGREGEPIDVWVYSNHDEVELFVNNRSQGRQKMERNGHLSWQVNYVPGTLRAVGYKNGKRVQVTTVETTGAPSGVALEPHRTELKGDFEDVSVVTVKIVDRKGRVVPDANHQVYFEVSGPAQIIGVGNGDPTSHEPCRFFDEVQSVSFSKWQQMAASEVNISEVVLPEFSVADWQPAFPDGGLAPGSSSLPTLYRASLHLTENDLKGNLNWMFRSVGNNQSVYVNGHLIGGNLDNNQRDFVFKLSGDVVRPGENIVTVVANPFVKINPWDEVNTNPGAVQVIQAHEKWQRKTFNGLAQIIIQSTGKQGDVVISASSPGLTSVRYVIKTVKAPRRPFLQ